MDGERGGDERTLGAFELREALHETQHDGERARYDSEVIECAQRGEHRGARRAVLLD